MIARSLPGADVHGGRQPLARWRLWAQVSDEGRMELRGDRGPRPVVLATDPYGHVILPLGARDASVSTAADEAVMAEGAFPLAAHADGSTSVVQLQTAATLWSDGDTMLDIRPEQWRPLTIMLAPPPTLAPPPLPPPEAPHPLRVAAARAGWMLSGVALTFIGGAAALGGGPLIQVLRSTLGHASATQVAVSAAPAPLGAAPPPVVAVPAPVAAPPPVVAAPALVVATPALVIAAPPLAADRPPAVVQPPAPPPPAIAAPAPQVAPAVPGALAELHVSAPAAPALAADSSARPAPATAPISKTTPGGEPVATRHAARSDRQSQRTLADPSANRIDTHRPIDLEDPFGAP